MKFKQPQSCAHDDTRRLGRFISSAPRIPGDAWPKCSTQSSSTTVTRGSLGNRLGSLMVDGRLSTVPAQRTRGFTFHRPRARSASGPALAKDYYHVEGNSDTDHDTMAPPDLTTEPDAGTVGVSLKARPRRARPATTPMRRYDVPGTGVGRT